jgi:PAS domain S-box-containing protein
MHTSWQSCPYTLPLFVNAAACIVVAVLLARRRPAPGATPFMWTVIACVGWSLGAALQVASADLRDQVFWYRLTDIGSVAAAIGFVMFAVQYVGATWLTRRRLSAIILVFVMFFALELTNDWHHLFYRNVELQPRNGFALLAFSFGPAGLTWTVLQYLLVLAGQLTLLQLLFQSQHLYRAQIVVVLFAVTIPALAEIPWLTGLIEVDAGPFAFTLSAIAVLLGLFRYRLTDIVPAARDTIVENMSDAFFAIDESDRIVDFNPAARRIIGREVTAAIGVPIERVLPAWSALDSGGADRSVSGATEMKVAVADSLEGLRDFEVRSSPVRTKDGRLTGRVLFLRDITEEKRTREALRQTEEASKVIIDSIEDGYYEIDLHGTFTRVTEATARIIGSPRAEVVGRTFREFTDATSAGRLADVYREVARTGEAIKRLEYSVNAPDGRSGHLEASASIIRDAGGNPVGFRGIIRDVTERKRVEEELQRAKEAAEAASQAKGAFLTTVSHELRTPLTSVLGFAKLIKKRLREVIVPAMAAGEPTIQRALQQVTANVDIIVAEGERLTTLINEVLDLAKIESGRVDWHMQPVSLGDLIQRARAATLPLCEQKKLDFRTDIEGPLPEVMGDPDRLMQVLINLISNAIKFTETGSVTCKARRHSDEVEVSVSDTGIGIAREDHGRVFEQFVQVDDGTAGKPQGTGLGLPISKQIVEHHGGQLRVESELGRGSTFAFSLPLREADQSARIDAAVREWRMDLETLVERLREQLVATPTQDHVQQKNILVVDDDPSIRILLHQELETQGYRVREAADGEEALNAVRRERPDLIILDVMMPGLSGFDVAAVLKNDPQTLSIPIIILSVVQDRERGLRVGVDRYLTKPIDSEGLLQEVGTLLTRGTSKKVLIVDEDAATVQTLTAALEAHGYVVVTAGSGTEGIAQAVTERPDLVVMRSLLSERESLVHTLRFEKGMEAVSFLLFE